MHRRTLLKGAVAIGLTAPTASALRAQSAFPDKPITFVVPFSAGGGGDIIARTLANSLSARVKQPVVVENRVGASGNIGAAHVLKSPPNGYTLLNMSTTYTIQAAVAKVPFDPIGDMQPIIMISRDPALVIVTPASPWKTAKDLATAAKSAPAKYTYGSAGPGSIAHLGMVEFSQAMGVELVHVPYKGTSQAFTDLIGGTIDMMLATPIFAAPYLKSGRARALGIAGAKRLPMLPDLPTFAEQGYQYNVFDWKAVAGPKGIPAETVAILNRELNEVLKEKALLDRFEAEGTALVGGPPEDMMRTIRSEVERWKALAEKAKVKIE